MSRVPIGVPAIDGMTLDYPVADRPGRSSQPERFLERMSQVYAMRCGRATWACWASGSVTRRSCSGCSWPTRPACSRRPLEAEAAKLAAYGVAVNQEGKGATMIDGVMSDRATDRHARVVLRQATALGRFDAQRAVALGIIDASELDDVASTARQGPEHDRRRRWG